MEDPKAAVGWAIFLVALFAFLFFAAKTSKKGEAEKDKFKKTFSEFILNNGITLTQDFEWQYFLTYYRVIVDDNTKNVYIFSKFLSLDYTCIPYSQIIGFDILEDSHVVGGIKRAVAGSVIAGGVGAIVGASTAHSKAVTSYKAVLYISDVSNPKFEFNMISGKMDKSNKYYKQAVEFAENINAVIKAIVKN